MDRLAPFDRFLDLRCGARNCRWGGRAHPTAKQRDYNVGVLYQLMIDEGLRVISEDWHGTSFPAKRYQYDTAFATVRFVPPRKRPVGGVAGDGDVRWGGDHYIDDSCDRCHECECMREWDYAPGVIVMRRRLNRC